MMVVSQAETTERITRAELDGATSRRAELQCQTSAAQSEADSARTAGLWSYVELLWGVDSDWDFKMVLTTKYGGFRNIPPIIFKMYIRP